MKYVSIDIETTGLDPEHSQILSVAAVIDDSEHWDKPLYALPSLHLGLRHAIVAGEPRVMAMHRNLLNALAQEALPMYYPAQVWPALEDFIFQHGAADAAGRFTAAGKNFAGFDLQFLKRLPYFGDSLRPHHRVIDPGVLYLDWATDLEVPDSATCSARADVPFRSEHDALEDACNVIRLIRKYFSTKEVQHGK